MKKIFSILISLVMVFSVLSENTYDVHAEKLISTSDNISEDTIYYNDFTETTGKWLQSRGNMEIELEDKKLSLFNNEQESIILNGDDVARNKGDLELTFTYDDKVRCFGAVIRADKNDPGKYQSIAYQPSTNNQNPTWSIGQPGGKWNSYRMEKPLENGKNYRMLIRYNENNIKIFLNGSLVLNEDVVYSDGSNMDAPSGVFGIRKYCDKANFKFDRIVSGPYESIPTEGFPKVGEDLYYSNFSKKIEEWEVFKGTANISSKDGKLVIENTSTEALVVNTADKVRTAGDIELKFTYQANQRCFGPTFRMDRDDVNTKWNSVVYSNNEALNNPNITVGQPGGNWNSYGNIDPLEVGKEYTMLVRYKEKNITVYLNGQEILNEEIKYNGGTQEYITGDWEGLMGIRKHCTTDILEFDRIISADYGVIPVDGFGTLNIPDSEKIEEPIPEESQENLAQYLKMKERWRRHKTGDFTIEDLNDSEFKNHIENLDKETDILLREMRDRNFEKSDGVWEKTVSDSISANITTQFSKLATVTTAYSTFGSKFYENETVLQDIQNALEYLTREKWFDGEKVTGNWWDFQVGVPQQLIDILIMLHDVLPEHDIKKYANIIHNYIPTPEKQVYGAAQGTYSGISFGTTTTGANRTDLTLSYLGIGLLLEKEVIVEKVVGYIEPTFKIVNIGDGFYEDGSFIQHSNVPYTGSYGNVLIKGVGKILSILDGSKWQLESDKIDTFSKIVYDSFVPVLYKGETMPMVGGRSISRAPNARKQGFGSATIYNLLITSNFASEPYKTKLKEAAKFWILKDNTNYYFTNNRDFRDILEVKDVLNDSSISGDTLPFVGAKMFGSMDRFVHSNGKFSLGISMHSNRISSYESGNKENKKGWNTSDGMVYIQNEDNQYGETFWPTVDWYRLPGTTVDTRTRENDLSGFTRQKSSEGFVGGSTSGSNSSVAMTLNKNGFKNNGKDIGLNLKANKSWFIIDDKIIALGGGIDGQTNATIETIVENRLLDKNIEYTLKSSFTDKDSGQFEVKAGDWIILEDENNSNNNLGYVFLESAQVELVRETRSGKYFDINESFVNDKTYEEMYQKVIIHHGQEVSGGHYAYAMLPSATLNELREFSTMNLDLVNDTHLHMINFNNVTAANIWSEEAEINEFTVKKPSSLVIEENGEKISLFISSPDHKVDKLVVEYDALDLNVISHDSTISVDEELGIIMVDVKGSQGKTHLITFNKNVDKVELESLIEVFENYEISRLTEFSRKQLKDLLSNAQEVYYSTTSTQETVDTLVEEMKALLGDLEFQLDFDALTRTIESLESLNSSDYTQESWNAVVDIKKEAIQLIESYDETKQLIINQKDIDNMRNRLVDAIMSLELNDEKISEDVVDIKHLNHLILIYENLDANNYTTESYKKLEMSVNLAYELLETDDYSQKDVDELVNELIINILNLEEKDTNQEDEDVSVPVPDEENNNEGFEDEDEQESTSDSENQNPNPDNEVKDNLDDNVEVDLEENNDPENVLPKAGVPNYLLNVGISVITLGFILVFFRKKITE